MAQNWVATFALLLWPLVVFWLYTTRPSGKATIWAFLGAFLLLPVGASIKIVEGIPQFDKVSISALAALLCCRLVAGKRLQLFRHFGFVEVLMLVFVLSPFITAQLNTDPIILPNRTIPGSTTYEGFSAVFNQFIVLIPFLLGRQLLRDAEDNRDILVALVTAGLFYSLPMLFEIRFSPQLHGWIYGYFPTQFAQTFRYGGFRPVVFMGHGLIVGFFAATTVLAAVALWRTQKRLLRLPLSGITAYLAVILMLCKTLGVLLYALTLAPLIRWTQPRMQLRIAVVLATLALSYPLLRSADAIPMDAALTTVAAIDTDRASSLKTRFDSETVLLARASERITFGWGRFGRNRIYSASTGQDMVYTDGEWILILGSFGVVGFLAAFGLLTLPVFRAASAFKFTKSSQDGVYLAALSLIVAANIIDLIPNATISDWTLLLAGALFGRAEALRAAISQRGATSATGVDIRSVGPLTKSQTSSRSPVGWPSP